MSGGKKAVCMIIPWFGQKPEWIKYFFITAALNESIDFLFLTDNSSQQSLPGNFKIVQLTLQDLNMLFSERLGFEINITNPYKLCDFKPAYGYIFEEYLEKYDYWGYCDMDIILGDIRKFINAPMDYGYQIISPDKVFFPGHFCLLEKGGFVNSLFMQADNYKDVFRSNKNFYFDEVLLKKGILLYGKKKDDLLYRRLKEQSIKLGIIKNLKWAKPYYNFVRAMFKKTVIKDFNSIITANSKLGRLKVFQEKLYLSDIELQVNKCKNWQLDWRNGKLFYLNDELLYFHFQFYKGSKSIIFRELDKLNFILEKR